MATKVESRITLGKAGRPPVRYSYLHAFVPKEVERDGEDGKPGVTEKMYSCQVLIDKKDTATRAELDAMIEAVGKEYFNGKIPSTAKLPLRDGDEEWEEKGEAVKGHWFFNCSSKHKPQVVGTEKNELTGKLEPLTEDQIKSGDYGRISVNFYGFKGKQKGIAVGLGNIQKLSDGEPLGNQRSADDDFGDMDDGFKD